MLLKRFYDNKLAQASYLVGCQATGDAIVIDANRDIDQYVRAAAEEGVRVTSVTETHIHADFVSGSRELAQHCGARLLLSDEGGNDWRYAYAKSDNAQLLHDGDVVMIGNIKLDVLHTPGHTPEHVSFIVTDTRATDRPMGVFTGDFIFVGDVGRPDLLERAARIEGTMESGARTLFESIRRFTELPDYLQLWPGHGAGSACGKALGAVPSTTLGYERIANWGLTTTDEEEFVRTVLAGQPEPPRYFAEMKRINRDGPAILGAFRHPLAGSAEVFAGLLRTGALIVDTRPASAFAAAHVPGTINIPVNKSFTNWAGSLIPYDREFHLLGVVDEYELDEAVRDLAMIGLDWIGSWFGPETIETWIASGRETQTISQMTVQALADRLREEDVQVIDVRGHAEWEAGHIPGVPNVPLGQLTDHLTKLSPEKPIVLHCQGGGRSSIAASIVQSRGFTNVTNLTGGFAEWAANSLPIERE